MNVLEHFVASTESARSDVLRYLRQMRELDERIEYHLGCMREIAEWRQLSSTGSGTSSPSPMEATPPGRGRGRGRGRPPGKVKRQREDDIVFQDLQSRDAAEARGREAPSHLTPDALYARFCEHRDHAQRHCAEREQIASEATVRGTELRHGVASRLQRVERTMVPS